MPSSNHIGQRGQISTDPFRIVPLGDSAITIECGDEIDEQINVRVVTFANTISAQGWSGIRESVWSNCGSCISHYPRINIPLAQPRQSERSSGLGWQGCCRTLFRPAWHHRGFRGRGSILFADLSIGHP
jgi:Carboxyltransferase domain, subdomain C and D